MDVWLPLMCPLLVTWPTTQACAMIGSQTSNPLILTPALNPLSHTSQGTFVTVFNSDMRNTTNVSLQIAFSLARLYLLVPYITLYKYFSHLPFHGVPTF